MITRKTEKKENQEVEGFWRRSKQKKNYKTTKKIRESQWDRRRYLRLVQRKMEKREEGRRNGRKMKRK